MRLNGKVALVVGAADYLGSAVARRLAAEGAAVGLLDRPARIVAQIVREIRRTGGEALALPADPVDKAAVTDRVGQARKSYGHVDILVNTLMQHEFRLVEEVPERMWDEELELNLKAAFLAISATVVHMKERKYGRIVNISSTAKDGVPWFSHIGHSVHAAARGGVAGFTRALAYELGRYDITVNCVVPGPMQNPRAAEIFDRLQHDPQVDVFPTAMMALKRLAKPEDVANAVLFLSSDEASYVTGHALYVSGGLYGG